MPYQYGMGPYHPQYGGYGQPYGGQTPVHGFIYVNGLEGARAYQMPPNSEMPLFDSNRDGVMYVKQTDGAGYATITEVECTRKDEPEQASFVTRDDLDQMYQDLASQLEQLKEALHATVPAPSQPKAVVPAGGKGRPARRVQPADED